MVAFARDYKFRNCSAKIPTSDCFRSKSARSSIINVPSGSSLVGEISLFTCYPCLSPSLAQSKQGRQEKGLFGRIRDAVDENFDVKTVRGLKAEAGWKLKAGKFFEFSPSIGAGMLHRVYEDGNQELVFGFHAKLEQAYLFLIDGKIGVGHEWGAGHLDGQDLHGIDRSLNVWDGTFLPAIFDGVEFGPKTPLGDVIFEIHPWGMAKDVWQAINYDDPDG